MIRRMLPALILAIAVFSPARTIVQASPATPADDKSEAALDSYVHLLRADLRSGVKQLIAANLELTNTEATKFWPVYDQYAADLTKINDQRYALVKEYAERWGKITDDQALSLSKRSVDLDQQVAQLRGRYLVNFSKVVPGTRAATFLQLDRRIQELIDLQLASQLPLIQEQK